MAVADITVDDVLSVASELEDAVTDEAWVFILGYVNEHDLTALGDSEETTQLARIYLAAHLGKITVAGSSLSAGPITAESVGTIRRQYAAVSASSSDGVLGTTRYGQTYLQILRSSLACGPFLI